MTSRRRRGATAIFAFLTRSLEQISTFVITLLAARFLLPAEYGIYSLAIIFIGLIQTLTYTGFYNFVVNAQDDEEEVLGTSFGLIMGISVLAMLALIAIAGPAAALFDAPDFRRVLILLALIQPVAGGAAWASAVLLRRQKMRLHVRVLFWQNVVALIGGVLLLWLWQSLLALVAYRYLRVLTGAALYLMLMQERPARRFSTALARRAAAFSSGLYGARLMKFLSRYAGDLLLGALFTTAEAGLYRFGSRVAGGATDVVAQPMRSFALTQFGAAVRAGREVGPLLERFVGTALVLTGGVAAVIAVFARPVVTAYFDPAYLAAITVTYAMAARAVFGLDQLILEPVLAARHRTGVIMVFNMAIAALTVASVLVAAPFGLQVLAWSQVGVAFAAMLGALLVIRRATGIAIGGALRAALVALGLTVGYGLTLAALWAPVSTSIATSWLALLAGLALATALGGVALLLAWRLKVFSLGVFSG